MGIKRELSSTFRRSLFVAIPVATVVGLTALAYAGLTMFNAGDPLSAATMNANFAALQSQITALQGTGSSVPAGTILAYGGPIDASHAVPAGWLVCDGSAVSRTTYATLLTAIGVGYGTGDQVTTFNLPDLRGYFLRGLDTTTGGANDPNVTARTAQNAGGNTGAKVGTFEPDAFASHNHGVTDPGHTHSVANVPTAGAVVPGGVAVAVGSNPTTVATSASGTGISIQVNGGSETRPKNVAVNYLIKF